jgi:hypothetical protein
VSQKGLARICMEAYAGDPTSQFYCGTGAYHQALRYLRSEDCETSYLPGACFIWRCDPLPTGVLAAGVECKLRKGIV